MNVLRFPYVYAIGLALLLRALNATVPTAIERPLALLGETWIPLMLILLGVELSGGWRAGLAMTHTAMARFDPEFGDAHGTSRSGIPGT